MGKKRNKQFWKQQQKFIFIGKQLSKTNQQKKCGNLIWVCDNF